MMYLLNSAHRNTINSIGNVAADVFGCLSNALDKDYPITDESSTLCV